MDKVILNQWTPDVGMYVVRHAGILYNKRSLLIKVIDRRTGDIVITVPASEVQAAIISGDLDFSNQFSLDEWMGNNYGDQMHDLGLMV